MPFAATYVVPSGEIGLPGWGWVSMLRLTHVNESPPTPPGPTDPRLLQLDPLDNVLCVTRALSAGMELTIAGESVVLSRDFSHGDKLAAGPIPAGASVRKYGQPIGTATQDIACGEWVHLHNLRSNYLPTYLHGTQDRFFEENVEWQAGEVQP
ncbi:MAG: UxaA family hydrolase [Verrucomicrobiales bacterium]|nr:UxaA family hydrolase [Verrucomicrobiales bacterium]